MFILNGINQLNAEQLQRRKKFVRVLNLTVSVGIGFREAKADITPSFAGKMIAESKRLNALAKAAKEVLFVITRRRLYRFTSD